MGSLAPVDPFDRAVEMLRPARRILAFTGAGISTESGIPDFRGPEGLWTKVDPDDFTIGRYLTDAGVRVRGWQMHVAGELWGARSGVTPNPAHHAIVALDRAGRLAGCVTQNIDGLHQVAGLAESQVAELHGNVRKVHCLDCGAHWDTETVLEWVEAGQADPSCPECGGLIKTTTVMFGELLPEAEIQRAWELVDDADGVVVVGSTVSVYPAAEIPVTMAIQGHPLVVINQGETEVDYLTQARLDQPAGTVLPRLVEALVGG